ncbi:MAG: PHP domain-containing protein [Candidatus Lambdaproteobacteria bacterium]|nr:PHP domain-containing protein [Candidatus Lambdaproteobacteria bacterium]
MPLTAIDLHAHSSASDGALAPEALVALAAERAVGVLALTDHDTLVGVEAACRAGERLGLRVLPGIEISTYEGGIGLHILGLGVTPDAPGLTDMIQRLGRARTARLGRILCKLRTAGVMLAEEDVLRECRAAAHVGRAHIARAMVRLGLARNFKAAFDEYLGVGRPAFEEIELLTPAAAIDIVHAAGGVASLAHPTTARLDPADFEILLSRLAASGLDGLEVDTPAHTRTRKRYFRQIAATLGLLETGGSDFHEPDCGRLLGNGTGRARLKPDRFQPVLERLFVTHPRSMLEIEASSERPAKALVHRGG